MKRLPKVAFWQFRDYGRDMCFIEKYMATKKKDFTYMKVFFLVRIDSREQNESLPFYSFI